MKKILLIIIVQEDEENKISQIRSYTEEVSVTS